MRTSHHMLRLVLAALLCAPWIRTYVRADDAAAAPEAVFRSNGLTKVGFLLETAQEAEVHTAANTVRALKSKLVSERLARADMARAVQTAEDICTDLGSQLTNLNEQMGRLPKKDVNDFNNLVPTQNALVKQLKQREAARDELLKKQANLPDSEPAYGDATMTAARQADAATAGYAALSKDAALTAAIGRFNRGAPEAVKLGPSGSFSADVAFIKKCAAEIAAEGIPVNIDGNVPLVEAAINGQKVVMIWDSGASNVTLSGETAKRLGINATDQDPTVKSFIADGTSYEEKVVALTTVKVGPYTVRNVTCELPINGKGGADLLGGAFQSHFIARLDRQAGLLHLTPLDSADPTTEPSASRGPSMPPPAGSLPPSAPRPPTAVEVSVDATHNQKDPCPTGVVVAAGQTFTLEPNPGDKWCGGGTHRGKLCDYRGYTKKSGWMTMRWQLGTTSGDVTSGIPVVATQAGEIQLYADDSKPADNTGAIRVRITTASTP